MTSARRSSPPASMGMRSMNAESRTTSAARRSGLSLHTATRSGSSECRGSGLEANISWDRLMRIGRQVSGVGRQEVIPDARHLTPDTSLNVSSPALDVIETLLPGVVILQPKVWGDERGFFMETYQQQRFREIGIDLPFVQDNQSRSALGV